MKGEIKEKRKVGDDGEWVVTELYFIDNEEVTEEAFRIQFPEQEGTPMFGNLPAGYPLRSDAMAVHSKQIPAVMERNKRHGLNVQYDRVGRPILENNEQRKKLMKIEGLKQQNSYYGA